MGTSSNQPHAAFRSFGPAFIKAIFTERFMARTLSAVIKPDPPILINEQAEIAGFSIPVVTGTVRPFLGKPHLVTPDDPCEVIFEVPLRLDLTLSLLGFDPYQGTAQLQLTMTVRAHEPAFLHVTLGKVQPEAISVTGSAVDWLVAALGTLVGGPIAGIVLGKVAADIINGQVRTKIAEQINTLIRDSAEDRWIELPAMVQESLNAEGDIQPTSSATAFAPVVGPDQKIGGRLARGGAHFFDLMLRPEERVILYVYAREDGGDYYNKFSAELSVAMMGPKGRAMNETDLGSPTAWAAPHFTRTEAIFDAPHGGRFRFRIRQNKGAPVEYFVLQHRVRRPYRGKAICFDELGQNFLHMTFNTAMLGENLARQLKSPPPMPFSQMGISGEAASTVALTDLTEFLPPGEQRGAELFFQAYIRVVTTVRIESPLKQTWEVPATVRLRLRVHTEVEPAAIRIDPDPVQAAEVEVKEGEVKRTDGGTELGLVRDGLIATVQGRIAETINGMLTSDEVKQSLRTVIAQQVEKPMPEPAAALEPTILKAWEGTLPVNGAHFHRVVLKRGKTLRLDVRLSMMPKPKEDRVEVTIALFDCNGGMVPHHIYVTGAVRDGVETDSKSWEVGDAAFFSTDAKVEAFQVRILAYGGPVRYILRPR